MRCPPLPRILLLVTTSSPASPVSAGLDAEVSEIIGELKIAYAVLLTAVPDCTCAIDVERRLGLNKKLAWQVFRVARAENPLEAGARVPGPAATREVLRAAKRYGLDDEVADRVATLSDRFHAMVQRHAADRSSFDLMLSAVTRDGLDGRNRELKRSAFRANRQLLGKYCEADVFTLLVHPGAKSDTVDMCSLRGLVDLHRLRPTVGLEIARHRYDFKDGAIQQREAIDNDGTEGHGPPIALLRKFCSQPIPDIRQVECSDGFVRSFAETSKLGRRAAVTCFLADVTRNSDPSAAGDRQRAIGSIHEIATPSRVLYLDCLVDERICGDHAPALRVLTNRRDADAWPADDPTVLLPVQERVDRIGKGPSAVTAPEVAQYPEMIEHLTVRLGWDANRLVLFRTRIEHPVLNAVAWMRFGELERWSPAAS